MTTAQALVRCLELEKVTTVFGYPGAAICPFYDELSKSDKITHVLVRHEANAGHAASGMARITGAPAVCCATSGPGALNLITAIATAYMDSIPIVAITGQVCTDQIGKDVFQEADTTGAVEPFVKHSFLVKDAKCLPETVKKAFYIAAKGRPGPVLIDVPFDILNTELDELVYPDTIDIRGYKPSVQGNCLQIKRVVESIAEASRPLICAGGGLFSGNGIAAELMQKVAERANIPVVNTMMGIGCLPCEHKLSLGMIGMHGKAIANRALNDCDLLILFGARINDRAILAMNRGEICGENGGSQYEANPLKIIHVDVDPAEIGKNVKVAVPVVGDLTAVLEQVLEQLQPKTHTEWTAYLSGTATALELRKNKRKKPDVGCNPQKLIQTLNKLMPTETVVVADVGQNQIWTAGNITVADGGRFMTSGGMGTMGYSVPCAIGVKKAQPAREVIAICGDGSFQMQMAELATAVQHGINIKIVIMVNNRLGMVRELQELKYGGNTTAVELDGNPDFVKLAAAYGIDGEWIERDNEIDKALIALLASKKPHVLAVRVDENERTLL